MGAMGSPRGKRVAIAAGTVALVVLAIAVVLGWRDLLFWYRFSPAGRNAQGYVEYRHRQTDIVFVLLPGGRFLMGAQKEDPNGPNYDPEAEDDEAPVHEVTLRPFLIAKHELTQTQWKAVMGSNPSQFKGDDLPVETISWNDIQGFEAKTGLTLPTEAQWEYACRGGTSTPFAGTGKLDDMGWYDENSGRRTTHPVGKKSPNAFGLYDLHGNVWEWCEDVYDEGFYKKPEARETDPCSDSGSVLRVVRGGRWRGDAGFCRSSNRLWIVPSNRDFYLGCRPSRPWP
jgi:formylglycine-generating enzyme required for sulfatase activity